MRKTSRVLIQLALGLALFPGVVLSAPRGKTATVKGYVLDSACAFVKDLKKPVSPECAVACAKAGSPLVILSDEGMIYWPVSSAVPAVGQNDRLLPFAGKRVTVQGEVLEKGGSRAMVIASIKELGTHP